ncbi:MAG TPA: zinc-dependent alcohol dehydrogenase family protein [Anaerolineae bacterium]|nr:zinc-dependent alcohol dehydrogenase family protein [Anaerolineae bacterium]
MHVQLLDKHGPVDANPLKLTELPDPAPRANEIRIRIHVCGVCHTDLHIVEGEIHPSHMPIVPGHQIVGTVEARGENAKRFELETRVGVPWLNWIDPNCKWFGTDRENLCENIRFTGFDTNGGYADYVTIDENFAYDLPPQFSDENAAPLLCAGVIGYRALRLSEIERGERIGLFGFGSSAEIVLQIAKYWKKQVYVFTRSPLHQQSAHELGADWVGTSEDTPPHKLNSAVNFAPVGNLMVRALELAERGATVVHAGIHSTPIPSFDYELLYHERTLRSAANSTRRDVQELLDLAAAIPIKTEPNVYPLADANRALQDVKHSKLKGAAVLSLT